MATYLLDTNIIIDVLNEKRNRAALLQALLSEGHLLACCPINVVEVFAGMRPKEEPHTEALLDSLRYFPITFPIARLAGLLKRDYRKTGKTLNIADATIAAVAIHHNLPLITDNVKDFPMKQLQLHTL
ncbi:MAG: type II toxin-antitoxin system VapC family toxin [Terriglobia bacterium]